MNRSPSASSAKKRPARLASSASRCGRGTKQRDERGREEEARRVEPERGRRAERRRRARRRAARRRAGALLDRRRGCRSRAPCATPGELDDVGEERGPRRRSRRVEERADEDERHELPELDPDRRVQQRDRGDGAGAREIGDDARRAEPEPVDDDAAEERREDDREEVEEDDEAR